MTDAPRRIPLRRMLILAGLLLLLLTGIGVYLDYRSFDQTRGGYDPPYTDWTGTPIDWTRAELTDEGFRQNGRVINSFLHCTTGMISFEAAGLSLDYRPVSPRAIAVHEPREACEAAGFTPEF